MRRIGLAALAFLLLPVSTGWAEAPRDAAKRDGATPRIYAGDSPTRISYGDASLAKAPTDTFVLYGGPGSLEGKFQNAIGDADRQGWEGVDRTFQGESHWQISTFNAETLGGHGAGNNALWCGRSAAQVPGWSTPPGYGNGWFDILEFASDPVAAPADSQTVALDFYFHHDTEPNYDYFVVEYDSAGVWIQVLSLDGSNRDSSDLFASPGLRFSDVAQRPIFYAGSDYGGPNADQVRIRLLVLSDWVYSDEDGLAPSVAGAVQIDDLSVTWSDGSSFDDMENGLPADWSIPLPPFAGDFAEVYTDTWALDACVLNQSGVVSFVDKGQDACPDEALPWVGPEDCSTGGTISGNHCFGCPWEPWVVNYNGGLSGVIPVDNAFVSPPIAWDLPGSADDAPEAIGARLQFDAFESLPLINGIFYDWQIRSAGPDGIWSVWKSRNFIYYSQSGIQWRSADVDITDLLEPDRESVQIALGARDLADLFGFPGNDATRAPNFDNVTLKKFEVTGPRIQVLTRHLAQDGFPVYDSIDVSTQAARDMLDVPFSMAQDIRDHTGTMNVAGDSIAVDAIPLIPGTTVADFEMRWVLERNPLFEDAIRQAPNRAVDRDVDTSDPLLWTGAVAARDVIVENAVLLDRYYFDLPDVDFLYPGDVLRYAFVAMDDQGRVTTLPDDISELESGRLYDRQFQVRALPSLETSNGDQPHTLVILDAESVEEEAALVDLMNEFAQNSPFDEFDLYRVKDPSSRLSNGIGSTGVHGASAAQLSGYRNILYTSGSLSLALSDGSDSAINDKGDDVGVLTAWHALGGDRRMAYFGDELAAGMYSSGGPGATYVQTILNVRVRDTDVSDDIDGQLAPQVLPLLPNFSASFVADGDCPSIRAFDGIEALAPAVRGHAFANPNGVDSYGFIAASVFHERVVVGGSGPGDVIDLTFPFALSAVPRESLAQWPDGRVGLLSDVLCGTFGWFQCIVGIDDGPPGGRRAAALSVYPSPFNPKTTVSLYVPQAGQVSVVVYDLRGRSVKELLVQEVAAAGELQLSWDGRDATGSTVASGVYVVRAKGNGFALREKIALLK